MKTFLTLFIISFFVYNQALFAQSNKSRIYSLLSLEDKEVSVKLEFDGRNNRYILELSPNEKMCISEAIGLVQEIKVLAKKFIELQVLKRGGTGVEVCRYILVCISNDKLCRSIDLISLVKNTVSGISATEVNFTGLIEKNNSFELILGGVTALHFDFDNKIFSDGYEYLNGLYYVNSDKDPVRMKMIFHNEKYPTLFNQYIFIRNKWYEKCLDNQLMEFTSSCN